MSGPRGYGSRSSELPSFGSGGSSPRQRGSLNAPLMSTDVPRAGSGAGATGKKVGIVGSMANLANAAIGAGVLAFPLAYQEAGIVLGPLLTVAFGTILGYTLHIIASAADVARKRTGNAGSYQEIVKTLLGPTAENAIIILQVVYLTGCNVCMLMIICDQVSPVLLHSAGYRTVDKQITATHESGALSSHFKNEAEVSKFMQDYLPAIAAWFVCFPLSLIRDMGVFAWPSSVSQLGIFYSVGVVVYHSARAGFTHEDTAASTSDGSLAADRDHIVCDHIVCDHEMSGGLAMISSLPLICFGFQCHLTFSLVYDSLADPTPKRIGYVSAGCMLLCACLYITMGVFGFLLLGDNATADVLADLSSKSGSLELDVSIARFCVAVKVACSYAMLGHVTKVALKDLILGYDRKLSRLQHVLVTAAFVLITMVAAIAFGSDLQAAMAFSGILVVIMVAIFPGILKIEIAESRSEKCVGWLLILFGVAVGVVSLVVEILKLTGDK